MSIHSSIRKLSLHGKDEVWNQELRWILIQAANTAARKDDRLRKFYLRIAKRHGHNIAITYVANKMVTIIWHMLVNKKLYNERKQSLYETKLKRIQKT
jgi:transposase